ncbi:MAG: alpha/beta fold hydrolase [Candidatus Rokuibacteriota bacterium]
MRDATLERETFGGTYPFAPHYRRVNGVDMHFVDEGAGEPVVLLHGDPTWGYLWRHIIPPLARRARCIVPDHMGMGKSDVPRQPYPYRLAHHVANLEALVIGLDLRGITLAVHDWGGPVGLGVAVRHPDRIKRLVITNTWAAARWPGAPFPRLIELIRSPAGEKFVLEKNGYLERALTGTTHHPERLTGPVMDAYRAPFPTRESRVAMLCWSRDIPVAEADPSYPEMRRIEDGLSLFARTPTLIVWGMLDPVLPPSVLRRWQAVFPHAITHEIADASHFLQEDAPDEFGAHLRDFVAPAA